MGTLYSLPKLSKMEAWGWDVHWDSPCGLELMPMEKVITWMYAATGGGCIALSRGIQNSSLIQRASCVSSKRFVVKATRGVVIQSVVASGLFLAPWLVSKKYQRLNLLKPEVQE